MSTWRQKAASVITEVINRIGREDMPALKRAISEAYPFGERAMHPYKIWLSEVKRQLNEPAIDGTLTIPEALKMIEEINSSPRKLASHSDAYRFARLSVCLRGAAWAFTDSAATLQEKDARLLRRPHKSICVIDDSAQAA